MLDYRKERLWDEVQAIADRKYGWDDGLPVEITAAEKPHPSKTPARWRDDSKMDRGGRAVTERHRKVATYERCAS